MSGEACFVADTACECAVVEAVNFGERLGEHGIDMIVLHYTGMEDGVKAQNWLCMEKSGVSCHYIVHLDGSIVQMVPEEARAWHAGKSIWHGCEDINSRSIGIEIVNPGHEFGYVPFPPQQIDAVIALCRDCMGRQNIAMQNVIGHSDIAPLRKMDPGELFPWQQLHENGIGAWVEPEPIRNGSYFQRGETGEPIEALQSMLVLFGYGVEINGEFDELTESVVAAFQRHFRPEKIDGVADHSTITTLHKLLRSLPNLST